MNQTEYIKFHYNSEEEYDAAEQLFEKLKDFQADKYAFASKEDELYPEYMKAYFGNNPEKAIWNPETLTNFLIFDFDAVLSSFRQTEDKKGILEFRANAYPYGGPEALISLLKSLRCQAYEVDDGTTVHPVFWKSEYEYTYEKPVKPNFKAKWWAEKQVKFNKQLLICCIPLFFFIMIIELINMRFIQRNSGESIITLALFSFLFCLVYIALSNAALIIISTIDRMNDFIENDNKERYFRYFKLFIFTFPYLLILAGAIFILKLRWQE